MSQLMKIALEKSKNISTRILGHEDMNNIEDKSNEDLLLVETLIEKNRFDEAEKDIR